VLELKANPSTRARGTVLESEMHKGMGPCATILVQNGTLKVGDSLVLDQHWARVKTMRNEFGKNVEEAGPSTPVEIAGLSGIPEAGQEFIVVKNEREAREIAEQRALEARRNLMASPKKLTMENMMEKAAEAVKKTLTVVLRTDVQGSLEALKVALGKIVSSKVELNIISAQVGEITESDVNLAAVSKAIILGFHTKVESHADSLLKQLGVKVRLHDIIYHAVDDIKEQMLALLDKIAIETEKGKVHVKALFKSSQHGVIAGCQVTDGIVNRNHIIRVMRNGEQVWRGSISSLKRVKEDVREVSKGQECGVLLSGFNSFEVDDILESIEVTYITQEL
jgi:translation initiation factor IF-2